MMKTHHSNQIETWKGLKLIKTNGITLRDYQIDIAYEAAYKLSSLRICYLAMQMRTGKTLTALACASVIYKRNSNVLFVTKKKAISSIESDAKLLVLEFDLTIINYESLHKIPRKQYDLVICDEAHCVGSAYPKPSERYSQLKMIMGANTSLLLLSGTPSPESYSQLFHQFKLSSYSPFHATNNFYAFAKEFVNVKKKRINATVEVNDYSDCNWKQLEPVLDKYFIRYNQKSAGFINEISEEVIEVEMKPITYHIAATLKRDKIYEGKSDVILADTPVKLLNKLHQIFSGSVILESEKSVFLDNSKIVFIQENYEGEHIAIFYKFQAEGEQLKKSFKNWTDDPNEFNADYSKVFIAQVQSVKEGVNLSSADTIIFYNIDFSSSTYQQARERASHKDRVKDNNVVFLVAMGGIERSIYEVVQKKQDYSTSHYIKIFGHA